MKKFENMSYEEQKEVVALFTCWLKHYTHEVIVKVLERRDEIMNNESSMMLLKELKEREEKETKRFNDSMFSLVEHFDDYKEFDPHNHCLTHSGSYRDVLYDLYIR